jgi:serine/threonine-protein kinase
MSQHLMRFLLLAICAPVLCCAQTVTTLAGNGSALFADGLGTGASFRGPAGVAVAASGVVFVGDTSNHRIRRVTPAGVVSSLAGGGAPALLDGVGTGASFRSPRGVAVDPASGAVVVADSLNHCVRAVTPGGAVHTLAGSGAPAFGDGVGTGASFNSPSGVAVGADGLVFVADQSNHRIRQVAPTGAVTTLAGDGMGAFIDGAGAGASFNRPAGVAIDGGGALLVADAGNHRIRILAPTTGAVSTLAGGGGAALADGVGTACAFDTPSGIAVDANGAVLVADTGNNALRKIIVPGGGGGAAVSTLAGGGAPGFYDGVGTSAAFSAPEGVAVDGAGSLYIADGGNNRLRLLAAPSVSPTPTGSPSPRPAVAAPPAPPFFLKTLVAAPLLRTAESAVNFVTQPYALAPAGAAVGGGFYFIDGNRIRAYTLAGAVRSVCGEMSSGFLHGKCGVERPRFNAPLGLASHPPSDRVFVADTGAPPPVSRAQRKKCRALIPTLPPFSPPLSPPDRQQCGPHDYAGAHSHHACGRH